MRKVGDGRRALLSAACGHGKLSRGHYRAAAGASGIPARDGADAHDLCHDPCGDVPAAHVFQGTAERADNSLETRLENQQHIQKMKHDMKGYTATLSGLLAEGRTEDALTYLKGVEMKTDALLKPFCPNPYIHAVFVHYAGKFEKTGAAFKHAAFSDGGLVAEVKWAQ